MKKDGNVKLRSKFEILEKMNQYLNQQIEIADSLEKEYYEAKEKGLPTNKLLHAYNQQIQAVNQTCSALIKTDNSQFNVDIENQKEIKSKELVD